MTDHQHPITPPPELVQQWLRSDDYPWGPLEQTSMTITTNRLQNVATQAAQWGADQELEACLKHLFRRGFSDAGILCLRSTRRPKPPSLKELALEALQNMDYMNQFPNEHDYSTIRRALEALD
jgi:hypothetical protein